MQVVLINSVVFGSEIRRRGDKIKLFLIASLSQKSFELLVSTKMMMKYSFMSSGVG